MTDKVIAKEGLNEEWLRVLYPNIDWDSPQKVSLLDEAGRDHLACRYCIALIGLKGTEVSALPKDEASFKQHLKERHGR